MAGLISNIRRQDVDPSYDIEHRMMKSAAPDKAFRANLNKQETESLAKANTSEAAKVRSQLKEQKDMMFKVMFEEMKHEPVKQLMSGEGGGGSSSQMSMTVIMGTMASTEQMLEMRISVDKLQKNVAESNYLASSQMLKGSKITYTSTTGQLEGEKGIKFYYGATNNDKNTAALKKFRAKVNVKNKLGTNVYSKTCFMDIGPSNCFNWDGRDDNGALCQDGEYSFDIVALDERNISIEKTIYGTVAGIERNPDSPCGYKVLMEDGSSIDPENIESFTAGNTLKEYMPYVGKKVGVNNTIELTSKGYVEPKAFNNPLPNTGRVKITYFNKYNEEVGHSIIFSTKQGENNLQGVQAYLCDWSDLSKFESNEEFQAARKAGKLRVLPPGTYTHAIEIEDQDLEEIDGEYQMQMLQGQYLYEGIIGVHSDDAGEIEFLTASGKPLKLDDIKTVAGKFDSGKKDSKSQVQDPKSYMGMYVDYLRQFGYMDSQQEYTVQGLEDSVINYHSGYTAVKDRQGNNQVTVSIYGRNPDGSSGKEIGSCKGYFQANKTYQELFDNGTHRYSTAKVREHFAYSEYDNTLNQVDNFNRYYKFNKDKVDAFVATSWRKGKLEQNPNQDELKKRQVIAFDTSTFTPIKEGTGLTEAEYNMMIFPDVTDASGKEIKNVTGVISTKVRSVYNDGQLGLENGDAINPLTILNARGK